MTDPMLKCGKKTETTLHYLLRCSIYSFHRIDLLNDICAIDSSIKNYHEDKLLITLVYESEDFNNDKNYKASKYNIKFLVKADYFNSPLFKTIRFPFLRIK